MRVLFILVICLACGTQALGNSTLVQRLANDQIISKVDIVTVARVSAAVAKAMPLMSGRDDVSISQFVQREGDNTAEGFLLEHHLKNFQDQANGINLDQLPSAKRELPEYMRDETGLTYDVLDHFLHAAVAVGDYGEVARLLAEGEASVNDFDRRGRAPIHIAVEAGDIHMVALLISNGADVDVKVKEKGWRYLIVDHDVDKYDYTSDNVSVIYPVERGDTTKVKIKDEFFNTADRGMFMTPTYLAADGGHRDILALLLLEGASTKPFVRDRGQDILGRVGFPDVISSARAAAENGDLASIVLLNAAGYNIEDKTDIDWETPFYLAVSNNRQDIAAYLLDKMPEDEVVKNLYSVQNTAMAERILKKITRIPLYRRDLADDLLYSFVTSGKVEIVKFFIDKYNLSPNARNSYGRHVLEAALYEPSHRDPNPDYEKAMRKVLIALLERGANPHHASGTYRTNDNKTIFDLAREKGLGHLLVPYLKEGIEIPEDALQAIARQEALAKYAQ